MPRLGLKQFRSEGTASYIVWALASQEALVIDPRFELMEDYRDFIASRALKPRWVIDTQTHSDHFSASHLFKLEYDAQIGMSHRTASQRPTRRLVEGELIQVGPPTGQMSFRVLETPGVAADAIVLYCEQHDEQHGEGHFEGLAFTGQTVAIGTLGRTELPGADPAQLWRSVYQGLTKLPETTLLYPADVSNGLIFSTLGKEKNSAPEWKMADRESFVAYKRETSPSLAPGQLGRDVELHLHYNREASPSGVPDLGFSRPRETPAPIMPQEPGSIGIAKYAPKLKEHTSGHLFVDVREPEEFTEGRMPGSINIPLSEIGLHFSELSAAKRVYFSCRSGARSLTAAKTLSYLGLTDVVDVAGGYMAWVSAGFPIEK